jgi:hypothetical protein
MSVTSPTRSTLPRLAGAQAAHLPVVAEGAAAAHCICVSPTSAPGAAAATLPPDVQFGSVETYVAAEAHVWDSVRARLREHPGRRDIEQRGRPLGIE